MAEKQPKPSPSAPRKGGGGGAAPSTDKILDTALTLIGAEGWRRFTLDRLAREADIPVAQVADRFASRLALVRAAVDRVDHRMLADVRAEDEREPHRDRLFDLIMRRIDALAPHKDAVRELWRCAPYDPELGLCLGWRLRTSMQRTLEAAGIDTRGLRGMARIKGLCAVWMWTLRAWFHDDSPEHEKTMKTLDRALGRAESWEHILHCSVPMCGSTMSERPKQPTD